MTSAATSIQRTCRRPAPLLTIVAIFFGVQPLPSPNAIAASLAGSAGYDYYAGPGGLQRRFQQHIQRRDRRVRDATSGEPGWTSLGVILERRGPGEWAGGGRAELDPDTSPGAIGRPGTGPERRGSYRSISLEEGEAHGIDGGLDQPRIGDRGARGARDVPLADKGTPPRYSLSREGASRWVHVSKPSRSEGYHHDEAEIRIPDRPHTTRLRRYCTRAVGGRGQGEGGEGFLEGTKLSGQETWCQREGFGRNRELSWRGQGRDPPRDPVWNDRGCHHRGEESAWDLLGQSDDRAHARREREERHHRGAASPDARLRDGVGPDRGWVGLQAGGGEQCGEGGGSRRQGSIEAERQGRHDSWRGFEGRTWQGRRSSRRIDGRN